MIDSVRSARNYGVESLRREGKMPEQRFVKVRHIAGQEEKKRSG
jgi:hypothetical protein